MSDNHHNTSSQEIPYGFCHCGCGQKTKIADRNEKRAGHIKGQPIRFIHGHNSRGSNNPNLKGWTITSFGYKRVKCIKHIRSDRNGYIFEHILVAEEMLNRPLNPSEVVHHIDGNRLNNHPDNLYVFCNDSHHKRFHRRLRAFNMCGHWHWLRCQFCKQYDDPKNMYVKPRRIEAFHHSCLNIYRRQQKLCCII